MSVDGEIVGQIDRGLLILLGVGREDNTTDAEWMATKLTALRLFENEAGKLDASVADIHGEVLIVSQFTLYGDVRKGRRPSFSAAAPPESAQPLYRHVIEHIAAQGVPVTGGSFGARMHVSLTNDGPVTLWLDSRDAR